MIFLCYVYSNVVHPCDRETILSFLFRCGLYQVLKGFRSSSCFGGNEHENPAWSPKTSQGKNPPFTSQGKNPSGHPKSLKVRTHPSPFKVRIHPVTLNVSKVRVHPVTQNLKVRINPVTQKEPTWLPKTFQSRKPPDIGGIRTTCPHENSILFNFVFE